MNKLTHTCIILALSSLSAAVTPNNSANSAQMVAQSETAAMSAQNGVAQAAFHSPSSTDTCSFNFTTGTGHTFLKYCLSTNGNIVELETPEGIENIAVGAIGEGYGICDASSNTRYFDYADFGDSGNWGPAIIVTHNATTVKIARTTSDGIYTLTQTFTVVPGALPSIKIAMTLKNNSPVTRAVLFVRYADVDADSAIGNNFDTTVNSAFAWNSLAGGAGFGLQIQNVGHPVLFGPLAFSQPGGPDPCNLSAIPTLQSNVDGAIGILYNLNIARGASTTVTASYRGM